MTESIRVYMPAVYDLDGEGIRPGEPAEPVGASADRAAGQRRSLVGEVVAIVDNCKLMEFGKELEQRLLAHGAASVIRFMSPTYQPLSEDVLDEVAAKAAGVLAGLGNCGSCTTLICRDGVLLTRRGVASATLITPEFRTVAKVAKVAYGASDHEIIEVRHDIDFVSGAELGEEAERVASLFMSSATSAVLATGQVSA